MTLLCDQSSNLPVSLVDFINSILQTEDVAARTVEQKSGPFSAG